MSAQHFFRVGFRQCSRGLTRSKNLSLLKTPRLHSVVFGERCLLQREPSNVSWSLLRWQSTSVQPVEDESECGVPSEVTIDASTAVYNFDLSVTSRDFLKQKGITHFTEVQAKVFDPVREGRNVMAKSRTGTGKTLGFGLPLLERLNRDQYETRHGRVRAVVMAPTRELVRQIYTDLEPIARGLGLKMAMIHGGVPYGPQENALHKGVDLLIATPGRAIDHYNRGTLELDGLEYFVLDEADRMLDMGFSKDIETLFEGFDAEEVPTLLFSATQPPWITRLTKAYMTNPVVVDVIGDGLGVATTVEHLAICVPVRRRAEVLEDIINRHSDNGRCIVFSPTKSMASELVEGAGSAFRTLSARALHGDIVQTQRDRVIRDFKTGSFQVLVATDVAARGLDVSNVPLVIQMEPPPDMESYVHRSGRTGRAGAKGVSILMYTHREESEIARIEKHIKGKIARSATPNYSDWLKIASASAEQSALKVHPATAVPYTESAQRLLSAAGADLDDKAVGVVAQCLAAQVGRGRRPWSLLSGRDGQISVSLTSNKPIRSSREAETLMLKIFKGQKISPLPKIGSIVMAKGSQQAILELPVTIARDLFGQYNLKDNASGPLDVMLEECVVLPPLAQPRRQKNTDRGGRNSWQRGGRQHDKGGYRNGHRKESEPHRGHHRFNGRSEGRERSRSDYRGRDRSNNRSGDGRHRWR